MAPELVFDDNSAVAPLLTSSTDVWSFACTAYEVFNRFLALNALISLRFVNVAANGQVTIP